MEGSRRWRLCSAMTASLFADWEEVSFERRALKRSSRLNDGVSDVEDILARVGS